jgi:hypothetical protein
LKDAGEPHPGTPAFIILAGGVLRRKRRTAADGGVCRTSGAGLGGRFLRREPLGSGDQLGAGHVKAGHETQQCARRRISGSGFELPNTSLRDTRAQRERFLGEAKLFSPFAQGDTERVEELGRIWHRATLIGRRDVCNVVYVVHRALDRGAMAFRCGAVHTGS